MKYLIILEETSTGYSAYSPDIPGCAATGKTAEETERNISDAIQFHFDGLREENAALPTPHAKSLYLQVA